MFTTFTTSWANKVEAVIGNLSAAFRLAQPELDMLKTDLIRDSFAFHYRANAWFRRECGHRQLTPDDLQQFGDLQRIPLIAVQTFKRPDAGFLLSVPLDAIDLEIQSTGTSGFPSVARRDAITTTRASLALLALYREFFGIARGVGLMFCPSPAEVPEMGMVKVFNLLTGLLDDRAYLVRDYSFDPAEAVEYLRGWADRQTRHILGPPFLVNRLLTYLQEQDLRLPLDPGSFAITLGGWKRFNRERICRSLFDRRLETYLGIQPGNSRDLYGMIESNLLAVECEHHRKHLPPWCHVTVRDVNDFSVELPAGQVGVLGILDALSHSYPGFLLSEDVGRMETGECPCGRTGQGISFVRRLQGAELGCCAVTMEQHMAGKETVR
jgi:long-chain-fatty-acid---luciferin-component ligase